jgi:hypothetical protein
MRSSFLCIVLFGLGGKIKMDTERKCGIGGRRWIWCLGAVLERGLGATVKIADANPTN